MRGANLLERVRGVILYSAVLKEASLTHTPRIFFFEREG